MAGVHEQARHLTHPRGAPLRNTIFIDGELAERIGRYVAGYGNGGFQARLGRLEALRRVEAA